MLPPGVNRSPKWGAVRFTVTCAETEAARLRSINSPTAKRAKRKRFSDLWVYIVVSRFHRLLHHPDRDVAEVDEFALEPSARIGLGDQPPARVVEIDAVLGRVGLADPLPERVHLVSGRAQRAGRLRHAPPRVVDVLVDAVVGSRAVGIEHEV